MDAETGQECSRCSLVAQVLAQRPTLLAVARRRATSTADAEDAVQEATLRALERIDDLDPSRVDGWLKTVTINICRDVARERGRHRQRVAFQVRHTVPEPYVDETVAERAYAMDVARQVSALPVPQQTVLRMRAEALPIEEIASRLGVTAKSAESLLARGRRTMRAVAAGLQAVFIGVLIRPRGRRGGSAVGALAATSVAAALTVLVGTPAPTTRAAVLGATRPSVDVVRVTAPVHAAHGPYARSGARRPAPASTFSGAAHGALLLHAGPVDVTGGQVSRHHGDQTLLQSVQSCLHGGVAVTAGYVGCNAAG